MKFDRKKLLKKMKEDGYYQGYCDMVIDNLMNNIDSRLEKNLEEYINGEEITDIFIDKYCVNIILQIRKNMGGIIDAILALCEYCKDKKRGEITIWEKYIKM